METKTSKKIVEGAESFHEMGIDVGAIATKVLLLKDGKEVVGTALRATSMEPGKLAEEMVTELLAKHDLTREDISQIVATGQGRRAVAFADMARTEITAFARGAHFLYPEAEIAVDYGGQGVRVMKLGEMGIVSDFKTNDKCSSGTGCFLDTMAIALELEMSDVGELSKDSRHPENITTTCTVFMESELVSLVARGKKKEDIIAGVNALVARKLRALVNSTRSGGPVFLGGGVALNHGLMLMVESTLGLKTLVAKDPQFTAALGAALLAPKPWDQDDEDEDWSLDDDDEEGRQDGLLARLLSWRKKK